MRPTDGPQSRKHLSNHHTERSVRVPTNCTMAWLSEWNLGFDRAVAELSERRYGSGSKYLVIEADVSY